MISEEDVRYVARLARLRLEPQEVTRMTDELTKILGHVEKIAELDLRDVAPLSHVLDVVNVQRADEPRPGLSASEALRNAPEVSADSFRVPRMSG